MLASRQIVLALSRLTRDDMACQARLCQASVCQKDLSASMKKIAIVTGGGSSPGVNAVICAVAKAAAQREWQSAGIDGARH